MKCDTCGKECERLARVVIDRGYDRSMAKPLWNCAECFEKKECERVRRSGERASDLTAAATPR